MVTGGSSMINILDAICAIKSDAKFNVKGSDIDTCEINWLEGTTPISKEDIKTKLQELKDNEASVKAQKETDKTSGKQKLKDLGLTDDEIKALTGK